MKLPTVPTSVAFCVNILSRKAVLQCSPLFLSRNPSRSMSVSQQGSMGFFPALQMISTASAQRREKTAFSQSDRVKPTNCPYVGHFNDCMRFKSLTTERMSMMVFWVVTPRGLVRNNRTDVSEKHTVSIGSNEDETVCSSETVVLADKTARGHNSEELHRHCQ
jgi:hypothetical protein